MSAPDFKKDLPKCSGVDPSCAESLPHPFDSVQTPAVLDKAGNVLTPAVRWTDHDGWIFDHLLGAYFCPTCAPLRQGFDFLQGTDAERALSKEERAARIDAVKAIANANR